MDREVLWTEKSTEGCCLRERRKLRMLSYGQGNRLAECSWVRIKRQ